MADEPTTTDIPSDEKGKKKGLFGLPTWAVWTIGIGGASLVILYLMYLRQQQNNGSSTSDMGYGLATNNPYSSAGGSATDYTGAFSTLGQQLSTLTSQEQQNYSALQQLVNTLTGTNNNGNTNTGGGTPGGSGTGQLTNTNNGSTGTTGNLTNPSGNNSGGPSSGPGTSSSGNNLGNNWAQSVVAKDWIQAVFPDPRGTQGESNNFWVYTAKPGDTYGSIQQMAGWGNQPMNFLQGYRNNGLILGSQGIFNPQSSTKIIPGTKLSV